MQILAGMAVLMMIAVLVILCDPKAAIALAERLRAHAVALAGARILYRRASRDARLRLGGAGIVVHYAVEADVRREQQIDLDHMQTGLQTVVRGREFAVAAVVESLVEDGRMPGMLAR